MKRFFILLREKIIVLPKYVLPLILSVLIVAMSIPTIYYSRKLTKNNSDENKSTLATGSDPTASNTSTISPSMNTINGDNKKTIADEINKYRNASENKNVNDLVDRAIDKYADGNFDDAIELMNSAIRADKPNTKLYYLRGKIYESCGKTDLAIADYESAVVIDKSFADAYVSLAELYYSKDSKDSALEACNNGLTQQPENGDLIETRMYIYSDRGEYEKAINDAEALIKLEPTNPLGYAGLADFLVTYNEYDKSIANYTTALKYCTEQDAKLKYAIYRQRSLCYFNTDKYSEAINDFKIYYDANEYDNNIIYYALSYYYTEDTDNAITWFKRCINKSVEVNMASYYLASIYAINKEHKQALDYYSTCISNDYNKDNSLYNRGVCYKELGEKEKALSDFNTCLEVTKDLTLKQSVETAIDEMNK